MRIEFLVEDKSGERLIEKIIKKYIQENNNCTIEYNIKAYKGIGGLKKGPDAKNVKSEQLLSELPKRLRALQFQNASFSNTAIFVVVDNDNRNTEHFYNELNNIANQNMIVMDHVFCVAVEEVEAWLLGDFEALQQSYPEIKDRINSKYSNYQQDSICGTWEFLADLLTKNGWKEFRKKNKSAYEIGAKKIEWAEKIGENLNIRKNRSPSFCRFIDELDKRNESLA